MINLILALTPTIILITCVLVYFGLKIESGKYLADLRDLNDEQTRVMNLIFLKKMIHFFMDSKTSRDTDKLLDNMDLLAEKIESEASNVANDATGDIEDLHSYLVKINRRQRNLSSLEATFSVMVKTVLCYGIVVAAIQYSIILIYVKFPFFAPLTQINDIMLGATIVFGTIIIMMYLDIARRTKKVRERKFWDHDTFDVSDTDISTTPVRSGR